MLWKLINNIFLWQSNKQEKRSRKKYYFIDGKKDEH